jgi:glutamate dehydrogenase
MKGKKIRPNEQTVACYSRHLKDYERYFKSDYDEFGEQLEQWQDDIPKPLALSMVFIASLNDFPLIVSLASETGQDFVVTLKLFNEITRYLGLNKVNEQLAKMSIREYWERKVLDELQEDMKQVIGQVIKDILGSKAETCADYFEQPDEKPKINRYRRIYQDINSTLPASLFPYIALAKELEHLVDGH